MSKDTVDRKNMQPGMRMWEEQHSTPGENAQYQRGGDIERDSEINRITIRSDRYEREQFIPCSNYLDNASHAMNKKFDFQV